MKSQKNFPSLISPTALMLILLYFLGITFLSAQNGGEQISWDDEEEEEVWEDEGKIYDEALVLLDGEEIELKDNFEVDRRDTLDVSIRRLKPGSWVAIRIYKGGVLFKKLGWYANERGELDLEVRTGTRKIKGKAELYYVPSNGKKKKREVRVIVL